MSTVAQTPSSSATASAASANGSRNGLKAPSNMLHGSQANFAALLFQADEVPDESGTALAPAGTTVPNAATEKEETDATNPALQTPDPQAFMNWIGLQTPKAAPPSSATASTAGSAQPGGPGIGSNSPFLQSAQSLTPSVALPSTEPQAGDAQIASTGTPTSAMPIRPAANTPESSVISIAGSSIPESDEATFSLDKNGLTPTEASLLPPKVKLNAIRTNGAATGALPGASTSTLRLAAQHQVGMAATSAGAPASVGLVGLTGQAAVSAQDTNRLEGARAPVESSPISEPQTPEAVQLGDAQLGSASSGSGARQDNASDSPRDGSMTWGGTPSDLLLQADNAPAAEAAASAFQGQMDELTQQMGHWFANGTQSASLTLEGDGASPLDIDVTLENGKVSIRFGADEDGAREALLGNIEATLKPLLAQHGMSLADVQVTTGMGQDGLAQQLAQGQPNSHSGGREGAPPQSGRLGTNRARPVSSTQEAATAASVVRTSRQPQGAIDLFA